MLVAMRPDAPPDPAVETLEEFSDVGAFVILAPPAQERVELLNQLLGLQRHCPFGSLPYLVHETTDRLRFGIRIQRILSGLTTNLALGQMKLSVPALDFVAKELEAVPDMYDPRLLRMQLHAQLFQDSAGRIHCGSCLCSPFAGNHPIIAIPPYPLPPHPPLPLKRRQQYVTG